MTSDNSDLPHSPGRSALGNLLLKIKDLLGRPRRETAPVEATGEEPPAPETAEQEMIRGVMGLASKNVREIMIPRIDVVAVPTTIALNALVKVIDDAGHSRIPVYNETIDNIAGILYVKELLPFIAHKPRKFELKKMLHRPYFVPETMPLDDLLVEFKRRRLHLSCVVDEYGGFGGIITLEDIIEEIVGEIRDEYEAAEPEAIRRIDDRTVEVDGRVHIDELNEELGTHLPEDRDYDTVGGFLFSEMGKIPAAGEEWRYHNLCLRVLDAEPRKINRLRIEVLPDTEAAPGGAANRG